MRVTDVAASVSPVPESIKIRTMRRQRERVKKKGTYIICVDVPRHVSIRNELSVNIASDFTVPPAAVDVDYTDHVPLKVRGEPNQKIFSLTNIRRSKTKIRFAT